MAFYLTPPPPSPPPPPTRIPNPSPKIQSAINGNYSPEFDIFADETKENLYGVFIKGPGERYGPEFNGIRGGGYVSQHQKFQKTPGFYALKSSKSALEATMEGVSLAGQSSTMRPYLKKLSGSEGQQQVLFWMRELTELNLLDFIFSQQDRVGNIDYRFYWYYVKNGEVKRQKVEADYDNRNRDFIDRLSPEGVTDKDGDLIAQYNPIIVQRTFLNDNDAGTKTSYANFAKRVGHLDGMKHYSLKIYRKLHELNRDLQAKGEIYQWAANSIGLTSGELKWFRENTRLATQSLTAQCEAGMKFDLDNVDEFLVSGVQKTENVDCQNP
ncbi:MAG: hypothetical protein HRT44_06695 [Bdellovibrionales bacterium]|nr:hypothetical protein [Bdellovibrionales bacterium]